MSETFLPYAESERVSRSFGRRIAPFLILSCLLHLFPVLLVPSRPSRESLERKTSRQPMIVDLREHKEGLSEEPASLSPALGTQRRPAPDLLSQPVPRPVPDQPSVQTQRQQLARAVQPKAEQRDETSRKQREKAVKATLEAASTVEASSEAVPSTKDLIPTLQELMRQQTAQRKLHTSPLEQDGLGETPARVYYDAYLSQLKQKVLEKWNVSSLTDLREGTAVVWFVIGRDGSLRSLELLQTSGMLLRDHEAMTAIRDAFPLSPPPEVLLDEHGVIRIEFSFHYTVYSSRSRGPSKYEKWVVN